MPIEREKIRRALKGKGYIEVTKKKDHDFFYLFLNGIKYPIFTKLSRGSSYKEYSDDLVKDVYKQIRLSKVEFAKYVECSLKLEEYVKLLLERNAIG